MSTHEEDIKRLETKESKEQLYALLRVYDVFNDLIQFYCEDVSHPPKELNILYIRELVPTIRNLVKGLKMQPGDNSSIKLPDPYIPFEDLFTAEKAYRVGNQNPEVVMMEINNVYGTIKILAERVGALGQPLSDEIQTLLTKTSRLKQEEYGRRHNHMPGKPQKIQLADYDVNFIEDDASIMVGDKRCALPPYRQLYYFAEAMWEYPVGRPVPWDDVFDRIVELAGRQKIDDPEKNVMDRMYRLNKDIQEVIQTDDELFTRKDEHITRNFGQRVT